MSICLVYWPCCFALWYPRVQWPHVSACHMAVMTTKDGIRVLIQEYRKECKMKKLFVALLILVTLAGVSNAAMSDYILVIKPDTGESGFVAEIKELNTSVKAETPQKAFDLAVEVTNTHKSRIENVSDEVAKIDEQIAALQAQKEKLLSQSSQELHIYGILIAKDAAIYRNMLRVLSAKTSIEEKFGVDVHSVLFRPDPRGNIYRTKLIWGWMFGKWQE